jgi:DNA polymerase III alpha subunit (gram-positive type)
MSKPKGYFQFVLAMDCETTGLFFGSDNPSVHPQDESRYHQTVSWGFIVLNADTLEEVDRLYVEIKWDGISEWSSKAEAVHGLSKDYLEENGMSEEEACVAIGGLIMKYWDTKPVVTLGHNVATFDLPFLKTMMRRHGVELNFGNRHIDTMSAGFATFGIYNSDELFEAACLPERQLHNALEDIEYTVDSLRVIRVIFDSVRGT